MRHRRVAGLHDAAFVREVQDDRAIGRRGHRCAGDPDESDLPWRGADGGQQIGSSVGPADRENDVVETANGELRCGRGIGPTLPRRLAQRGVGIAMTRTSRTS